MIEEYRKYEYDDYGQPFDWTQFVIVLMVVLMAIGVLSSCKTKYVSVPEYHKEYVVRTDTFAKVDSVVMKDSVFVYHNGDTVIVNKVLYRDRVRNVMKVRTDTLMLSDSVRVPYPVEKTLGKRESRYLAVGEWTCKAFAWVLAAAVLALLAWLAAKMAKK